MRRALVRILLAIVGLFSLAFYAAGAFVTYTLLHSVWTDRPSAVTIVAVAAVVSLALGYVSYRFGSRRLLASMETVTPSPRAATLIDGSLDRLSQRMELERPTIIFTDLEEPNAFAMGGPSGGVVVFDVSLLSLLTVEEFEAVLAHELAHLENRDGLVQLLAFSGLQTVMSVVSIALLPVVLFLMGLAKATAYLRGAPSTWSKSFAWRIRSVVFALVSIVPLVVTFAIFAQSRRREYAADRRAATVTGNPRALASGLRKVEAAMITELSVRGLVPSGTKPSDPLYRLLATHPAVEERIERLERFTAAR